MSGPARPAPEASEKAHREAQTQLDKERRRQVRGLVLLAVGAIVFALLRAGVHRVFTPGWWRLW